jgi:hypothetical protein
MNSIDLSKPVRLKYPQLGEKELVYMVTNFNEVTQRCYIDVINLKSFEGCLAPSELVSINDIENIPTLSKQPGEEYN